MQKMKRGPCTINCFYVDYKFIFAPCIAEEFANAEYSSCRWCCAYNVRSFETVPDHAIVSHLFQPLQLMEPLDSPDAIVRYAENAELRVRNQAQHVLHAVVAYVQLAQERERRKLVQQGQPSARVGGVATIAIDC